MNFVTIPACIATELGMPVYFIWSRDPNIANDTYRPAVLAWPEGTEKADRIAAFQTRFTEMRPGRTADEGPFLLLYDMTNRGLGCALCESPVPVRSWRAVEFTQLGFFNEALMDELAEQLGADPLEFSLAHVSNPRIRAFHTQHAAHGSGVCQCALGVTGERIWDLPIGENGL